MSADVSAVVPRPVAITGGAGFIGTNLADRLARDGHRVLILDNLSRRGVDANLAWLKATHGDAVEVELADIRDAAAVDRVVRRAARLYHFAAQVAVTTSVVDPVADFEINARGTINLLEAMRALDQPPPLIFTSTNKVYGKLCDVALEQVGDRYEPADSDIRQHGIDESRPLDFYSPYGCSKGCADQYVLDYARVFELPTAVFRMSCIYGPHQFGNEDQGWVAHSLIRALEGEPITLYGDGRQVRDILYVGDLVEALATTRAERAEVRGQAFNVGGGPDNAVSLLELIARIGRLTGRKPDLRFGAWRPGDQLYYVSDTSRLRTATGWQPRVSAADGVAELAQWLVAYRCSTTSLATLPLERAAQ
jgi:CDP-paratose 2-epimerase